MAARRESAEPRVAGVSLLRRRRAPGVTAMRACAALLGMLALLAGCAQYGPALRREPGIEIPAAWTRPAKVSVREAAVDGARWWRRLGDPLLDRLVEEAMTSASDARSAVARLRQARAARDLADADLHPSLGANASANRSRTGVEAGGSGVGRTLYKAGLDASWELNSGLRHAVAAAQADAAAAAATLESTWVSLAAEVALSYVDLRASQARLAIAAENVASQAETLQITEWRREAGLASSLDVEQARTNLEQTRATLPALESTRAQAEHRLAVLTGRAPAALRRDLADVRPLPHPLDDIAVGIPADTLRQRPDVRAAGLTLEAEIARSAQQQAARYPSLSLSGSLGWQAFSAAALGGAGTTVQVLSASLAQTIFDGGRIRSRIAQQDAVQERALAAYEGAILTALEDVENALAIYAAARERVAARRRAAEAAGNAAALARTLYETGAADFQRVLETQRSLLGAQDALASAEADVLVAIVSLYRALGGGWSSAADTTDTKP